MVIDEIENLTKRYLSCIEGSISQELPNVTVFSRQETSTFEALVYDPVICLILQGAKETVVGTQTVSVQKGDALLVSHDLHVVMSASDRVICLNGHICCQGTPHVVSAAPEYRALFGHGTHGALALYTHEHDHDHDHDHGGGHAG